MLYVLSCFADFHCTAADCQHNCCIGWEIDIDADTLRKYRCLQGPLGVQLRQNIETQSPAHFHLSENGRCPMLENDGLCSLQKEFNEEMLCQICRDHPRYRIYLPGRTEEGLGLCCEEAARLLLSTKEKITLLGGTSNSTSPRLTKLLQQRQKLLDIAQNRHLPLSLKLQKMLLTGGAKLPRRTLDDYCEWMLTLEPLEKAWAEMWEKLSNVKISYQAFDKYMRGREIEYEQILTYFLLRHYLADEGRYLPQRAAFAALSTALIYTLGAAEYSKKGSFPLKSQIELCRMWSANVEYSDENMRNILHTIF